MSRGQIAGNPSAARWRESVNLAATPAANSDSPHDGPPPGAIGVCTGSFRRRRERSRRFVPIRHRAGGALWPIPLEFAGEFSRPLTRVSPHAHDSWYVLSPLSTEAVRIGGVLRIGGVPGWARTSDLYLGREPLYPAELRGLTHHGGRPGSQGPTGDPGLPQPITCAAHRM